MRKLWHLRRVCTFTLLRDSDFRDPELTTLKKKIKICILSQITTP